MKDLRHAWRSGPLAGREVARTVPGEWRQVAHETDFLDLYGKLRLEPGCSLDEFKQAYRRNVALWHPDRRRGSRADVLAAARLQRLTAQYGAAMDFYRRHGRLPGAPIPARPILAEATVADTVDVAPSIEPRPAAASVPTPGGPPRGLPLRWWFAAVLLGVGAVVWWMWPDGYVADVEDEPRAPSAVHAGQTPVVTIALGMTTDEVIAIEGEPTRRADDRWEYGPSWIRFEGDQVVDWYSSPLRALHVVSPRPRP